MDQQKEVIKDIEDIRSMMERSSKFFSLSGWAGVMAGIYALTGAIFAKLALKFEPGNFIPEGNVGQPESMPQILLLATVILLLTFGTAIYLSGNKAGKRKEKLWNPTSRRLLLNMSVPLIAGGILSLIMIFKGFIAFVAPLTLIFYGLALYGSSKFTYEEMRSLGLIQIVLGLLGMHFTGYGLLLWAIGFGVFHIAYGIYMHYRYEK